MLNNWLTVLREGQAKAVRDGRSFDEIYHDSRPILPTRDISGTEQDSQLKIIYGMYPRYEYVPPKDTRRFLGSR